MEEKKTEYIVSCGRYKIRTWAVSKEQAVNNARWRMFSSCGKWTKIPPAYYFTARAYDA